MIPFGFMKRNATATFDPATLSLTGWWRANYASPWTPTASAGTSGSNGNLLSQGGTTSGTAVNGLTPAQLDGTNDYLDLSTALATDVMDDDNTTLVILAKASAAVAAAANFYDDEGLITGSNGNQALVFTSSGVRMGVFDTASRQTTSIAVSTGVWFMAAGRIDKTGTGTVKCRVAAAGTTTDATPVAIPGTPGAVGANMLIGRNYAGAAYLGCDVLEIMTAKSVLSDADLVNIESYFNSRYGLSL
jgi:hypothetical protein